MDAKEAGIFMRGFGDGTRLRILDALSIRPLTVGGLSELLDVPLPKVSRHLRYLDARGLVEWATSGKGTQYRLAKPQHALHRAVLAAVLKCARALPEMRRDAVRAGRQGGRPGGRQRGRQG